MRSFYFVLLTVAMLVSGGQGLKEIIPYENIIGIVADEIGLSEIKDDIVSLSDATNFIANLPVK